MNVLCYLQSAPVYISYPTTPTSLYTLPCEPFTYQRFFKWLYKPKHPYKSV